MKNLFIPFILILFILSSCIKDDSLPNNEKIKWKFELESKSNDIVAFLSEPIIYEDILIIPRQKWQGEKGELIAVNKITGQELWRWSEAFDKYNRDGFSIKSHAYDGILVIGDNNYSAGINIYTGETIWENLDTVYGRFGANGVRENIFKTAFVPGEKYWIQKGNIYTGEWETIYELDKPEDFTLGSRFATAIEWNGKIYLNFHENHWRSTPTYESHYFLHLYNVTDDSLEWRTDTIPKQFPNSFIPSAFPSFNEGQILLANDCIYSYNITDGQLKWKNAYDNSFTTSTYIVSANGLIYGKNGDGFLICLDVHSGNEVFRIDTGGFTSRMEIFDDKVFISSVHGEGGVKFMVIDAKTGSVLNAFTSPGNQDNEQLRFQAALTVDKETGLAYAATYKEVLCYEFE